MESIKIKPSSVSVAYWINVSCGEGWIQKGKDFKGDNTISTAPVEIYILTLLCRKYHCHKVLGERDEATIHTNTELPKQWGAYPQPCLG